MKQPLLYGIVFSLLMPQCVDANEQNQNDQAKLNQAIKTEQQTLQKALLNKSQMSVVRMITLALQENTSQNILKS